MSEKTEPALHTTTWEDGGMAGYRCHATGDDHGVISVDDGEVECPDCGQTIRLHWHVHIETLGRRAEKPDNG